MGSKRPQDNVDVRELIAGEGSHLLWNNDGDVMDGPFGGENNVDNIGDASSDDDGGDGGASESYKKTAANKRFKRHSREQIQELEAVFNACPHPDENQRLELSKRVGMEAVQVKYWFQNRRGQKKIQIERLENKKTRGENEMLRAESLAIREALLKKACPTCGGPTVPAEETPEQRRLRMENARLKDEITRAYAVLKNLSRKEATARYGFAVGTNVAETSGATVLGSLRPLPSVYPASAFTDPMLSMVEDCVPGRSAANSYPDGASLLRLVDGAMEEFMMLAKNGEPMWLPTADGEVLNNQQYNAATFPGLLGLSPMGFVVVGTRETGMVMGTASDLVDVLTDAARWSEMFPGIVAGVTSSNVVVSGGTPGASRDGLIQLMNAELRVLSPRVPVRNAKFLRHSKLLEASQWAVVDVSADGILGQDGGSTADCILQSGAVPAGYTACRLLPTGCLIEDMNNGYCKVTWVVNSEYNETTVPQLYHPLLRSGQALGARHWLASLQRCCEYLTILRSDPVPSLTSPSISPEGRKSILGLARRMMATFCAAMGGPVAQTSSNVEEWHGSSGVGAERFDVAVRVVTLHGGGGAPGEQPHLVLSATTTVWLPGTPAQGVFNYLCDGERRGEWDTLVNGEGVQEGYVTTGQLYANAVSVLRPNSADGTNSRKLILQEACTDASCSLLVYAPVDEQSMRAVMNGRGHSTISLLPSGFAILPDGHSKPRVPPVAAQSSSSAPISRNSSNGSLVTAMSQKLLRGPPSEDLAAESIDNIGKLLLRAIEKIKAAVKADIVITA